MLGAFGELTSIDQWAVLHAMPGAHFTGRKPPFIDAVVPLRGDSWRRSAAVVTNILTFPAGALIATVIVAVSCSRLRRRAAIALVAVYVAGGLVEELVKATLTRPPLYADGLHVAAFDNSYPSGHTIRAVVLAVAVAAAWPRLRLAAAAWAAATVVFLELGGCHVPSDIVGGFLLAAGLLATTWTSWFGRASYSSSSRASRPSSPAR
jgi:membrane-associated phospholipid phosphatase